MRLVVWLGLGTLGVAAGGCLRETQHACEVDGTCGGGGSGDGAVDDPDARADRDARTDAVVMAIDAATGVIEHVPLAEETLGTVMLSVAGDRTIDTTTLQYGGTSQSWLTVISTEQGNQVALARLDTLTLDNGKFLDVTGALPLIIIARRIDVNGTIDASANDTNDGPGAILAGTAGGGDGMAGANNDDGGGGGGGHGTMGAAGGTADQAIGGTAGDDAGDADITSLGGGGHGGRGSASGCARAIGGGGGGALQLYASEMLSVNGTIDVSGGGGNRNGTCAAGGGGGGAGGALYLQSSTAIALGSASRLASNGGGGASGGGLSPGSDGADGAPGMFAAIGGGAVGGGGGAGGAGGVLTTAPVEGGAGTLNGGGGGGAVGRIVAHAPAVTATLGSQVSPAYVRRN